MMFMLGLGVILAIGLALFSFVDRKSIKTEIMNEVNAAMEGTRAILNALESDAQNACQYTQELIDVFYTFALRFL